MSNRLLWKVDRVSRVKELTSAFKLLFLGLQPVNPKQTFIIILELAGTLVNLGRKFYAPSCSLEQCAYFLKCDN
ncbi:hypothetical protein ACROYT_G015900 [Oculina patagonica]